MLKIDLVKLDSNAVIPQKANPSDAGFDLTAVTKSYDEFGNIEYDTKIAISIPENYVGLLFPRSSIYKKTLSFSNSVGVIDSGYTGSIKLKMKPTVYFVEREDELEDAEYNEGDRVGQLVILELPKVEFNLTDNLLTTQRGANGFGSSGK